MCLRNIVDLLRNDETNDLEIPTFCGSALLSNFELQCLKPISMSMQHHWMTDILHCGKMDIQIVEQLCRQPIAGNPRDVVGVFEIPTKKAGTELDP